MFYIISFLSRFKYIFLIALTTVTVNYTPLLAQQPSNAINYGDQIFNELNQKTLCNPNGVVDRFKLAFLITQLAAVSYSDIDANGDNALSPSEIKGYVSKPVPRRINKKRFKLRTGLAKWLQFNDEGGFEKAPFFVKPKFKSIAEQPLDFVEQYFSDNRFHIHCRKKEILKQPKKNSPKNSKKGQEFAITLSKITSKTLLRKSKKDLTASLNRSSAAEISFTQDYEGNTTKITAEGIIAVNILGYSQDRISYLESGKQGGVSWFNITPYVYYKGEDISPNSPSRKDISLLEPGMSLNYTYISGNGEFAFDFHLDAEANIDLEQDSREYSGGFSFMPSFSIGSLDFFGKPYKIGPLFIRTNLAVHGRYYYIDDAGTNTQLQNKSSYNSFGYDISAQLFSVKNIPLIANLKAEVAYEQFWNSDNIVDTEHFSTSLIYSPPGIDHLQFKLEYDIGRDSTTFQEEEKLKTTIGVKF